MSKISIIGAGFVGSTIAHWAMISGGCQVVLVDVVDGLAQGKVLDLVQAGPIAGHSIEAVGTSDYSLIAGSDLVVITAGVARKPGMTREDLVTINADIVGSVVREVVRYASPDCIILMMTNPLDTMTYLAYKLSGFPRERVIGQAGVLDSGRMRTFIAMETGVNPDNIHTTVLGGHGDEMVPLVRYSTIAGIPLGYFLSQEQIDRIVARTRDGGAEIVRYLKTGSAYYAPGAAACRMASVIIKDTHTIYPASVYLEGEYGLNDICFGVPVLLSRKGVERIIELDLNEEEKVAMQRSAELIRGTMMHLKL
jgi:malate dehydrogenase